MFLGLKLSQLLFLIGVIFFLSSFTGILSVNRAKDNGDLYLVDVENETTTEMDKDLIDFEEIREICNSSFSTPFSYYEEFKKVGALPNEVDRTGLCFIRCMYEKSGLLDNWLLNANKIKVNIWPATGDTIEVCEQQEKNEMNACVRAYAIAKCLMLRTLVDARNKSFEKN